MTVYELEESNFIRESPKVEVNSYQGPQKNLDASVDVFFGSKAPTAKESNLVYAAPGKRWISLSSASTVRRSTVGRSRCSPKR